MDEYGNMWVTPTGGGTEIKIAEKRSHLHEQFQEGLATNAHWEAYKGKNYVSDAKLVGSILPDKSEPPVDLMGEPSPSPTANAMALSGNTARPPGSITATPSERTQQAPAPQRSYSDGAAIGMVTNRIGSHIDNNTLELVFTTEEIVALMGRYRQEIFRIYGLDFKAEWPKYKDKSREDKHD